MELIRVASNESGESVAVGNNGVIYHSLDGGATWQERTSGTTNNLYGVAWGRILDWSAWCAVGENGIILTSPDGISWSAETSPTGLDLYALAFAGAFLAVGASGVLLYSGDLGATWEVKSSGTTEDLFGIDVNLGVYIIIGANDTVITGELVVLEYSILADDRPLVEDTAESTGSFNLGVTESFSTVDGYGWNHIDGGTLIETAGGELQNVFHVEGMYLSEDPLSPTGTANLAIAEVYSFLTTAVLLGKFNHTASDLATMTEAVAYAHQATRTLVEALTVADLLTALQAATVTERIDALVAVNAGLNFQSVCTEAVSLRELVIISWAVLAQDTATITSTANGKFEIAAALVERLTASGTADSRLNAIMAVSASMVLADGVEAGKDGSVTEITTITDALTENLYFAIVAIEAATLTATAAMTLKLSIPLTESVTVDETLLSSGRLHDLILDGVVFEIAFNSGDGTFSGWLMNTRNFGLTEYQDYPFNSLAKYQGVYLGCNSNGLYRLDGDDDAGTAIDWSIKSGQVQFPHPMNVEHAFLGFRSDGDIVFKTITADGVERWYEMRGGNEMERKRRKFDKGVFSALWQIEVAGTGDFRAGSIELIPVMRRR